LELGSAVEREAAVIELRGIGDQQAVEDLKFALADDSIYVRKAALQHLGNGDLSPVAKPGQAALKAKPRNDSPAPVASISETARPETKYREVKTAYSAFSENGVTLRRGSEEASTEPITGTPLPDVLSRRTGGPIVKLLQGIFSRVQSAKDHQAQVWQKLSGRKAITGSSICRNCRVGISAVEVTKSQGLHFNGKLLVCEHCQLVDFSDEFLFLDKNQMLTAGHPLFGGF
jgi:hypothetical protein